MNQFISLCINPIVFLISGYVGQPNKIYIGYNFLFGDAWYIISECLSRFYWNMIAVSFFIINLGFSKLFSAQGRVVALS